MSSQTKFEPNTLRDTPLRSPGSLRPCILFICMALLFACLPALADKVHLTNGRVLTGEVLEENESYIVLKVPYGKLKLRREKIEYIERQSSLQYQLETGRSFINRGRFIPALAHLEKAFFNNRQSKEAQKALAHGYNAFAEHLTKSRRLAEARRYYQFQLKLEPEAKRAKAALSSLKQDGLRLQTIIHQGRTESAAGELKNAILTFSKALAFDSDAREQIAPELGHCHARLGEKLFKEKKYEFASVHFQRAFELDPTLADRLESLYVANDLSLVLRFLGVGKRGEAGKILKSVLDQVPANRTALYLAGRMSEQDKKVKESITYYARGLNTRTSIETLEKLKELRRELEIALKIPEGGSGIRFEASSYDAAAFAKAAPGAFKTLKTAHFSIHHYNEKLAERVARVIEAHRTRIADITGMKKEWKEKASIFLHRTQEEYTKATAQPGWTGGVSKFLHIPGKGLSKVQIHTWQTSPRLFKSVIPHEVAHLVINTQLTSYSQLPRSLHEGFAVMMEPGFRHDYFLRFLRLRLRSNDFIPLAELLKMKDYPKDQEFFYAEGFALVYYLVKTKGMEQALRLIKESTRKPSSNSKLLQITGSRSLADIETAWKKWLRSPK